MQEAKSGQTRPCKPQGHSQLQGECGARSRWSTADTGRKKGEMNWEEKNEPCVKHQLLKSQHFQMKQSSIWEIYIHNSFAKLRDITC